MRDSGQDQRTILVYLRQVGVHLVEGMGDGCQFGGAAFVEAGRRVTRADLACGLLQGFERPGNAEHDQPGPEQRQQQRGDAPAQPAQRKHALDSFARQRQPVIAFFAVIDPEVDEQGLLAFALQTQAGVRPHLFADQFLHAVQERPVRQGFNSIRRVGRVDVYAFAVGQVAQKSAACLGASRNQCGARQVDDADQGLRQLPGAWFAFIAAENGKPGRDRKDHQQGDEQECAPQ